MIENSGLSESSHLGSNLSVSTSSRVAVGSSRHHSRPQPPHLGNGSGLCPGVENNVNEVTGPHACSGRVSRRNKRHSRNSPNNTGPWNFKVS